MDWSESTFQLREIAGRSPINHFRRFMTSRHTRDLVCICGGAIGLVLLISVEGYYKQISAEVAAPLVTLLLGLVGWAYQAGNTRFGVADLFAGEIAALCRIAAVSQLMTNLADQYRHGATRPPPVREPGEYFTAYNSNARDMEVLDGDVVEAVAQFYGNIKVFRDALLQGAGSRDQALTAIYYGFLAYESARVALAVLIDERGRSQEAVLMAMASELPAYILLYGEFSQRPGDVRWSLIHHRFPHYCKLIHAIKADRPADDVRAADLARQTLRLWDSCVDGSELRQPLDWSRHGDDPARRPAVSADAC